jgi:hypothetical protein
MPGLLSEIRCKHTIRGLQCHSSATWFICKAPRCESSSRSVHMWGHWWRCAPAQGNEAYSILDTAMAAFRKAR